MTAPSPLDCLTVVHLMWDFLDGELPRDQWGQVRDHLATCTGCRGHVDFCRAFLVQVHDLPVDALDVTSMRARLRAALRQETA